MPFLRVAQLIFRFFPLGNFVRQRQQIDGGAGKFAFVVIPRAGCHTVFEASNAPKLTMSKNRHVQQRSHARLEQVVVPGISHRWVVERVADGEITALGNRCKIRGKLLTMKDDAERAFVFVSLIDVTQAFQRHVVRRELP